MDIVLKLFFVLSLRVVGIEPVVDARNWGRSIKESNTGAFKDQVISLPGQPSVTFKHYAGYINVNQRHGRALFYWFYEATAHADEKPLLLWLNGGPGCSSVGYGATQEIGPFLVDANGSGLKFNRFSWNTEANLLFLESPIGVGFSYSNTSRDYDSLGDAFTGKYIPELAEVIVDKNRKLSSYINLRGILLGNPETHDAEDWKGMVDYAWSHAIVSDETHDIIVQSCNFYSANTWDNLNCSTAVDVLFKQYKEIDIYSLYTPVCIDNSPASDDKTSTLVTTRGSSKMMPKIMGGYDPCLDKYANYYYNRADVQKALHVTDGTSLRNWSICNMSIFHNWGDSKPSVLPIYKKLIKAQLRIWVYSGDTDGRVPVLSTRYSLSTLKVPIKTPWRPWYHKKQVAGWVQEYYGLTFATFRGAGHDVPTFKQAESLVLFASFLAGESLPSRRDE